MPLGRLKREIHGAAAHPGQLILPFVTYDPEPRRATTVTVAWLLHLVDGLPTANETIEQYGNASARGYRIEVLTTGAARVTAYRAGPANTAVSSTNLLTAADADKFFMVIAQITATGVTVTLNETDTTSAQANPMATPTTADHRFLGAQDAAGVGRINRVHLCQRWSGEFSHPELLSLSGLYERTRLAQRLDEEPGITSYIDFARYRYDGAVGVPFGDDVTGARVGLAGSPYPITSSMRADRTTDWSTV